MLKLLIKLRVIHYVRMYEETRTIENLLVKKENIQCVLLIYSLLILIRILCISVENKRELKGYLTTNKSL